MKNKAFIQLLKIISPKGVSAYTSQKDLVIEKARSLGLNEQELELIKNKSNAELIEYFKHYSKSVPNSKILGFALKMFSK